jgi:hypothetical protein
MVTANGSVRDFALSRNGGRHRFDVDDAGPRLDHAGEQREVLAQRVALEVRRQVHVAQVGVAVEPDAVHLVTFTLVPVGAGEHRRPRVDHGRVVGNVGLDGHADVALEVGETGEDLHARLTTGHALADLGVERLGLGGRVILALAVRRGHPVDTRQEAEERETRRLQCDAGLTPCVGADTDPEIVVRGDVGVDDRVADAATQVVDDALAQSVTG